MPTCPSSIQLITPLLSTPAGTVQRVDTFKLLGVLKLTGHVSTNSVKSKQETISLNNSKEQESHHNIN